MRALTALSLLLTLAACQRPVPPTSAAPEGAPAVLRSLEGTSWRLVTLDGRAPPDGVEATLVVDEARLGGVSGCNHYSAPVVTEGDGVTVGPVTSTRMACPGARMDLETAFLGALERLRDAQVRGERLVLTADGGEELVFERVG